MQGVVSYSLTFLAVTLGFVVAVSKCAFETVLDVMEKEQENDVAELIHDS